MKKALSIIIPIALIALVILGVLYSVSLRKIPLNPADTVGNLSGNLNNHGLFCESDGIIYFSNVNDNHYLYSMNSNGSNVKKLSDVPVSYINAGGDYLYFYYDDQGDAKFMGVSGNMRGIYRIKKNGDGKSNCLDRTTSGIVNLIGNSIYYQHYDNTEGMTLYSCSTDGKQKSQAVAAIVNPACVINGSIYYPDQENGFVLNTYRPGATNVSSYADEKMYNPTYAENYIYYMKVDDNYCLYRYDFSTNSSAKITKDRIDTFNVYGNTIFYQRNNKPALIKVNADGTDAQIVAEGNYTNINCTSTYTFFQPFSDTSVMYCTPTIGGVNVTNFIPVESQ